MKEITLENYVGDLTNLEAVLRRSVATFTGASTYPNNKITLWFIDEATEDDLILANSLAAVVHTVQPKLSSNYVSKSSLKREIKKWQSHQITSFLKPIL